MPVNGKHSPNAVLLANKFDSLAKLLKPNSTFFQGMEFQVDHSLDMHAELKALIKSAGGTLVENCGSGSNSSSQPLLISNSRDESEALHPDWVFRSCFTSGWQREDRPADFESFCQGVRPVIATTTGIKPDQRKQCELAIHSLGGTFNPSMLSICSHLIVPDGPMPKSAKIDYLMQEQLKNTVTIVQASWIDQSSQSGKFVDEAPFVPEGAYLPRWRCYTDYLKDWSSISGHIQNFEHSKDDHKVDSSKVPEIADCQDVLESKTLCTGNNSPVSELKCQSHSLDNDGVPLPGVGPGEGKHVASPPSSGQHCEDDANLTAGPASGSQAIECQLAEEEEDQNHISHDDSDISLDTGRCTASNSRKAKALSSPTCDLPETPLTSHILLGDRRSDDLKPAHEDQNVKAGPQRNTLDLDVPSESNFQKGVNMGSKQASPKVGCWWVETQDASPEAQIRGYVFPSRQGSSGFKSFGKAGLSITNNPRSKSLVSPTTQTKQSFAPQDVRSRSDSAVVKVVSKAEDSVSVVHQGDNGIAYRHVFQRKSQPSCSAQHGSNVEAISTTSSSSDKPSPIMLTPVLAKSVQDKSVINTSQGNFQDGASTANDQNCISPIDKGAVSCNGQPSSANCIALDSLSTNSPSACDQISQSSRKLCSRPSKEQSHIFNEGCQDCLENADLNTCGANGQDSREMTPQDRNAFSPEQSVCQQSCDLGEQSQECIPNITFSKSVATNGHSHGAQGASDFQTPKCTKSGGIGGKDSGSFKMPLAQVCPPDTRPSSVAVDAAAGFTPHAGIKRRRSVGSSACERPWEANFPVFAAVRVSSSGSHNDKVLASLRQFGVLKCEEGEDAPDLLIMKELKRFEVLLCAMAKGSWVVSESYIQACLDSQQLLHPQAFEWSSASLNTNLSRDSTAQLPGSMRVSPDAPFLWRQHVKGQGGRRILQGASVFYLKQSSHHFSPPKEVIHRIIRSGGGTNCGEMGNEDGLPDFPPDCGVLICAEQDKSNAVQVASEGGFVVVSDSDLLRFLSHPEEKEQSQLYQLLCSGSDTGDVEW